MVVRIEEQLAYGNAQEKLTETDKMIAGLMAQNSAFKVEDVLYHYVADDGNGTTNIDWRRYFNELTKNKKEGTTNIPITTSIGKLSGTATEVISKIRAGAQDYNTQFMLKLAVNDMEVLLESGQWKLPENVDFELMKKLANTSVTGE